MNLFFPEGNIIYCVGLSYMQLASAMKLSEYLARPGKTATDLARNCGVSVSTITRVARGEKRPSMGLLAAIFEHTKGKVKPNDFLPEPSAAETVAANKE